MIQCLKIPLEEEQDESAKYASETLAKPASYLQNFMEGALGHSNAVSRWVAKLDRGMQRVFLKKALPMDRELLGNVEQLKEIYVHKLESQEVLRRKEIQHAWRQKYVAKYKTAKWSSRLTDGAEQGLLEWSNE